MPESPRHHFASLRMAIVALGVLAACGASTEETFPHWTQWDTTEDPTKAGKTPASACAELGLRVVSGSDAITGVSTGFADKSTPIGEALCDRRQDGASPHPWDVSADATRSGRTCEAVCAESRAMCAESFDDFDGTLLPHDGAEGSVASGLAMCVTFSENAPDPIKWDTMGNASIEGDTCDSACATITKQCAVGFDDADGIELEEDESVEKGHGLCEPIPNGRNLQHVVWSAFNTCRSVCATMRKACLAAFNRINGKAVDIDGSDGSIEDGHGVCGDGPLNPPESTPAFAPSKPVPDPDPEESFCGDGTRQVTAGEECDDGNNDDDDECTNECVCQVPAHTGQFPNPTAEAVSCSELCAAVDEDEDGKADGATCNKAASGLLYHWQHIHPAGEGGKPAYCNVPARPCEDG